MRVLLPLKKPNQQQSAEGGDESQADQPHASTSTEERPPPRNPPEQRKKRPRTESQKPRASNMTGGRAHAEEREDSDSDDRYRMYCKTEEQPLENEPPAFAEKSPAEDVQDDFSAELKKRGLEIVEQEGDGNCLFRAVSLQVYGDSSMHGEVRERCLDFMARDEEHFSLFVTDEPFHSYISRKRQLGVHGNNPEIQAVSELFNRPVEVFTPQTGGTPINIFQSEYKTSDAPIRLSYHDAAHYNAVVNPLVPTAGLGLGMPGLEPGLADKMQVAKAVAESDRLADDMELKQALKESQEDALQRTLKESAYRKDIMYKSKAMALSDLDATNFELEQAALEESLESFSRQEQGRKKRAAPSTGRRSRRASPTLPTFAESTSTVAAIPPAAASVPTVASAAVALSAGSESPERVNVGSADEYPAMVQELVLNGFELRKVVHAYELIGDNFDDLLAFLLSTHT